jgi:hypothetical protein
MNNINRIIIKYKTKRKIKGGPKATKCITTSTIDESSSSARLSVGMNFQHPES